MKALLLSAIAAVAVSAVPAPAQVLTIGSSNFAHSCYRSAVTRTTTPRAKSDCDQALSVQALAAHDRVATHVNRGILWMLSGNHDRADRDFNEALEINPGQPEAWLNKAALALGSGDSSSARDYAARAIKLRTINPALAHYIRGVAHEDTGNLRAAYADLRVAASLAPKWSAPTAELARYQVRRR